jgi:hypothetical protein
VLSRYLLGICFISDFICKYSLVHCCFRASHETSSMTFPPKGRGKNLFHLFWWFIHFFLHERKREFDSSIWSQVHSPSSFILINRDFVVIVSLSESKTSMFCSFFLSFSLFLSLSSLDYYTEHLFPWLFKF